ncbi:S8 family peptidase [Riemerella anatipestifer]|uniref:S8 family peptidase n=1 Tax=Riemerella anatipestifer TaxID=34085 RepID=UPI001BDA6FE3|nr:S8 family serine peptidase [Riemerella anatipestifer]MBT0551252.1 S8 family serine peptidase [Riemerella anatipestifer]MBT0552892.1 S8 family serine peptidase [Riemerella anatipestifer]MCE3023626.1 S8 family serine peptidase [Riemerella anatipestifer]MCU7558785.1 S8 family serine peptidase [Riemerella anatipestifer]QYR03116.1 S8 family serine peptidase [Riemerella anatipestifer]
MPVDKVEPVLIYEDGTKQILNGQINIKVKPNSNLRSLIEKWNFIVEENKFEKGVFLLSSNTYTTEEIFSIVNELQYKNEVEFAEPNFIRLLVPHTNDPYFNSQWAIKNQGYNNGIFGADMKVEDAWNYSTGNGIKVAIIDEGVDLNHPDLLPNLLSGYDATGNNSGGGPSGNDAHGTACAGIVATVANNNIGTTGVAYNAKIIPVRIAYTSGGSWVTSDTTIANGINWAWQNGADVLSNSWGGGSYSSTIVNAINNAVANGRNGKGSVVLFSSGNNNSTVSFPATQGNVIAVGASSMCDERKTPTSCDGEFWWGSNFGNSLDVVAPGVKIYTTDISGSLGYNLGDYQSDFNGTSSACPNVAGVVALILSANPNLTQQEARDILERNTDKVGGYSYFNNSNQPNGTWNNEMGYGRVNALKAVEDVFFNSVVLNGNSSTCNSQQTYTLSQVPNNISPVWTHSSNLTKNNETSSSITVTPNTNTSGSAFVKAAFGTKEITKTFWVGKPSVSLNLESDNNYVHLTLVGANNTDINKQGITNVTWEKISNSGGCFGSLSGSGFEGFAHGNCFSWTVRLRITLTNSCGSTIIEKDVTPRAPDPCNTYSVSKVNDKNTYRIIQPPCDGYRNSLANVERLNEKYEIKIFNTTGHQVFSTNKREFSIDQLLKGSYYLQVIKDNQQIHTQTLIKE